MHSPFRKLGIAAMAATGMALCGCVAPVGPVEVTRFHLPDTAMLGKGSITVEAAPGGDPASLEFRSQAAAVARELVRVGYSEMVAGSSSNQIAVVRVEREAIRPMREGGPVSVGVGGTAGGHGSGLGIGIGLDLSGPPPEQVQTRLAVTIRERASDKSLWEGRAAFTVKATSPLANTQLGAAQLAQALFRDFPGVSGETILVK